MSSGEPVIRERVGRFIRTYARTEAIADGEDLYESGLLNSLFAAQLLSFVEEEFGIVVDDRELALDNFRSIDAITALVTSKVASLPAEAAESVPTEDT